MKVKLVKRKAIDDYMLNHARSRSSFEKFIRQIKFADWESLEDISNTFNNISIVCDGERIIFRIGGGAYRLICGYKKLRTCIFLYIKFIGTHSEYDKLNDEGRICEVNNY